MRVLLVLVLALGGLSGCLGPAPEPVPGPVHTVIVPTPEVDFTWSPEQPAPGQAVVFEPSGSKPEGTTITDWRWDFGDGDGSDDPAPIHRYVGPGLYEVTVEMAISDGQQTRAQHVVAVIDDMPAPTPQEGPSPGAPLGEPPSVPPTILSTPLNLGVSFSYEWAAVPDEVAWDFGDNSTSKEPAPSHVYAHAGTYEVVLSVRLRDAVRTAHQNLTVSRDAPSFKTFWTGDEGAEPSIGVTSSGAVFVTAGSSALRSRDHGETWHVVSDLLSAPTSFDPYLWVDPDTDRIFHDNLYIGCSYLSFSDDDGDSWTTNPAACGLPDNDHQKLATGPFRKGGILQPDPVVGYPNAVYYAASEYPSGSSSVTVSLDGGLTFVGGVVGPPLLCGSGGINGQPHGSPSGMAYLPFYDCDGVAVARSTDNALTWDTIFVDTVLGSGDFDPDMASDRAGTTYLTWIGADYEVYLSYTKDDGLTWSAPLQVTYDDIDTALFPTLVAGDQGRVALSYIGTSVEADLPDDVGGQARWYLYSAFLEDADTGRPSVSTARVTELPVQIGMVCTSGLFCDTGSNAEKRNLLEFIDSALDVDGRLWIVFTDGCGGCSTSAQSVQRLTTVARLDDGPSLYGAAGWLSPLTG